jgi:hypothetical protein
VDDYLAYAKKEHFSGLMYFDSPENIHLYDLIGNNMSEVAVAALMEDVGKDR